MKFKSHKQRKAVMCKLNSGKTFSPSQIRSIKRRTDINNHTENWVFIARKINEKELAKEIEDNRKILDSERYGTKFTNAVNKRYKLYQKLMNILKKKVSQSEYNKVYESL